MKFLKNKFKIKALREPIGVGVSLAKRLANFKIRKEDVKTIRLLYPDFLSGGLDEYYFGA